MRPRLMTVVVSVVVALTLTLAQSALGFAPPTPRHATTRRRQQQQTPSSLFMASAEAPTTPKEPTLFDDDTECIPGEEYCILDKDSGRAIRLTLEEKERIFMDALQAYYAGGRKLLPDDEFDLLKEDLTWAGSDAVQMNRNEVKYLQAMQDYLKGQPSLSDQEFDDLKEALKADGSKFAVQTEPKCYIDTGVCKVTLLEDTFRSNLLYTPAAAILYGIWLGIGFEAIGWVTGGLKINPLAMIALGAYPIYQASIFITENFFFTNKKIAYGPCPSCSFENRIYFGNILGVEGFGDVARVKCPNCKTEFQVIRDTLRASTLDLPKKV